MKSRLVASLAALAVVVGVAACGRGAAPVSVTSADASVSGAAPASAPAVSGTTAAARAFGGHGRLAFVSADRLYVLDGAAAGRPATRHAVAAGKTAGSPAWSPDGRWLAYLVGSPSADGAVTSGALWLAGPDGQGAHQVLPKVDGFAWSPTADELAATSGYGGKLFAVRPGKPTYPMLEVPGQFDGAPAWSPNGREVAVATVTLTTAKRLAGSVIDLFVPSEGIVVTSLASSRTNALIVDGWWASGEGLLAWSDPGDSAAAGANGLPLVSYALAGPTATLGRTLPYPSFAPPTWAGVAVVTGGDRYPWSAKTIRYCSVSGQCGPMMDALPGPANLDPASSTAKGEPTFAFAHCATEPTETTKIAEGASQQSLAAWYRTCRLYNVAGAGANALPVTRAGTGVAAPTMSVDANDILYVRDNALWLISMFAADGAPSAAAPTPVVGKLFAGNWPTASGYTAWHSQFAWFS
jgi:WD40 repeat protein